MSTPSEGPSPFAWPSKPKDIPLWMRVVLRQVGGTDLLLEPTARELLRNDEAKALFEDRVAALGATGFRSEEHQLIKILSSDPRWRLLVGEAARFPLKLPVERWLDPLKKLAEKWHEPSKTAANAGLAAAGAAAFLFIVPHIRFDQKKIELPVHVPITVEPTVAPVQPAQLEVNAKLALNSDGVIVPVVVKSVGAGMVDSGSPQQKPCPDTCTAVAGQLGQLSLSQQAISMAVSETAKQVTAVSGKVDKQDQNLQLVSQHLDLRSAAVRGALAPIRMLRLTIRRSESATLALSVWSTDHYENCSIEVQVGPVHAQAQVQVAQAQPIAAACQPLSFARRNLEVGDAPNLGPWQMRLESVQRPWFTPNSATLVFSEAKIQAIP